MPDIATYLETVGNLLRQHQIHFDAAHIVPTASLVLIGGIAISVLGAKLARPAFIMAAAVIGAGVGLAFAERSGYSVPLSILVSAGLVAAVGYMTFRLWVGVGVMLMLASLTFGGFGVRNLLPLLPAFEESYQATLVTAPSATPTAGGGTGSEASAEEIATVSFSIPSAQAQMESASRAVSELGQRFWSFATEKQPNLSQQAQALGIGTLIVGLFFGVLAVRWSLVLSTSLGGTLLVMSSVLALLSQFSASTYQTLTSSPVAVGITTGGFFLTSVILQALLTREAKSDKDSVKA
ncbi:MAG: hypothetical protein ACYTHJ_16330 [Planctomycetota bacterium]|jgi:hypothetical protein